MGETISTLVFRPPPPTYLDPSCYFFLDVETFPESRSFMCGATKNELRSGNVDEFRDHKIPAFFIKRRGASVTFLFSHGNAEDLGMMYNRIKNMARVLCVNVMAYDYTGYGMSTGTPSEEMCYRNIEAAYNYLRNVRNIPSSQIVLYGRSLGSGPSCYLAAKTAQNGESVAGLILHSAFLSVYRVVMDVGVSMAGDMFSNQSRAPGIRCPTLIVHGKKDEVVPFWHAQKLLKLVPPEFRVQPFWAEGLGHNAIEVRMKQVYVACVKGFLEKYVSAAASRGRGCGHPQSPVVIPCEERASVDDKSFSVFVNSAWVRHGKDIIREAVSSNKIAREVREKQRRDEQSDLSARDESPERSVSNYSRSGVGAVQKNEGLKRFHPLLRGRKTFRTTIFSSGRDGVQRYITTRDEVVLDDEELSPYETSRPMSLKKEHSTVSVIGNGAADVNGQNADFVKNNGSIATYLSARRGKSSTYRRTVVSSARVQIPQSKTEEAGMNTNGHYIASQVLPYH